MKPILKAVLFGALAAAAVFFVPFPFYLLLVVLLFALLARRLFGWRHGPRFAGPRMWGRDGHWAVHPAQPVTVDGRVWQRAQAASAARDVQVG